MGLVSPMNQRLQLAVPRTTVWATLAATLLCLSSAGAQVPLYEVVFENVMPPGASSSDYELFEFSAGEDAGWACRTGELQPNGSIEYVFFGTFSASDPLGPRRLRIPQTIGATEQRYIYRPSLANGKIAYLSADGPSTSTRSAWLDDVLIAQEGTSIGLGSGTWRSIVKVKAATDGSVMIRGGVETAGGPLASVIEYPSGQVLLQEGQAVPGTNETVGFILGSDRSSDGAHFAAVVRLLPSNDRAVLLDGSLVTLNGGVIARQGEDATAVVTTPASFPNPTWVDFDGPTVNASGEVAFFGRVSTSLGQGEFSVRNGQQVRSVVSGPIKDLDNRGFALFEESYGGVRGGALENRYLGESRMDIDVDGDGIPDPGYLLEPNFSPPGTVDMTGSGAIYATATLQDPAGDWSSVVIRRDLTPSGPVICPGETNSTGYPARLTAFGTSVVSFNRTELVSIGLPAGATALPLFSLTPNPGGVQPIGSVGTLCLGGPIGRGLSTMIVSNAEGVGSTEVFVNVLPQPNGPVAAQPGETWYAQLWYRDTVMGSMTSNFSDAIAISFR